MYIAAGESFNFLTAMENVERSKQFSMFECSCGEKKSIWASSVKNGASKSCGHILGKHKITHGKSGTRVYGIWRGVLSRCNNEKDPNYHRYGAKGIYIDERWETFENFYSDMGDPPGKCHQIDRINNDLGYAPGNCRWVTSTQNNNNKSNNLHAIAFGETKTVSEWTRDPRCAIKCKQTLRDRLKAGWDDERAITEPPARRGPQRTV